MKSNFLFVGILPNYVNEVGEIVANNLDMFTVSIDDLFQEELGNAVSLNNLLSSPDGQEKLASVEKKVAAKIADFENSIVCMSLDSMIDESNLKKILKSSNVVYLQVAPQFFEKRSKETGDFFDADISDLTFSEKDKKWVETSKIVLDCCKYKVKKAGKKLSKLCTEFLKELNQTEEEA